MKIKITNFLNGYLNMIKINYISLKNGGKYYAK